MSPIFTKQTNPLSCRILGTDRLGTILCLGGPGASLWMPIARELSDRYRLIIPEIFHPSDSERGSSDFLDLPELTEQLSARLRAEGVTSVHTVSWSMGATWAVLLGERFPEQVASMVWICGIPNQLRDPDHHSARSRLIPNFASFLPSAARRFGAHLERIGELQKRLTAFANPAKPAKQFGLLDPDTEDEAFNAVVREFLTMDGERHRRYTESLSRISIADPPVALPPHLLAISGERDPFVPAEEIRRVAGFALQCEYFEIISGTHYVPVEYGELTALKLDDFFKRKKTT